MLRPHLALAPAFLLFLAACDRPLQYAPREEVAPPILGTWIVEDIDHRGVIDNARLDATFTEDKRVYGIAACNSYTGSYDYAEGVISVGAIASTEKMCPPALMDMESKMLARLGSVTNAAYDETMALILSDGEGRLLLRRADDEAPQRNARRGRDDRDEGIVVAGALTWDEEPLPADALAVVRLEDVSRADAPATLLAEETFNLSGGPPATFTIAVTNAVDERARLSLRAQIVSGADLLYVTDTHNAVPSRWGRHRMELRLVRVAPAPSEGGALAEGFAGGSYECAGEAVDIEFGEDTAFVTQPAGDVVELDLLNPSADLSAQRTFTNGRLTVILEPGGMDGPRILFGRGRMIPQACREIG